jgi:lipopolysaccharide transport system ATP-binding protein
VGDLRYQQKCLNKMSDVSEQEDKTILYVSHIMSTVRQLCSRCLVLSHGQVVFDGDVEAAIGAYMETSSVLVTRYAFAGEKRSGWTNRDEGELCALRFTGRKTAAYEAGEPVRFELDLRSGVPLDNVCLRLLVRHKDDAPVGKLDSAVMALPAPGAHTMAFSFSTGRLAPGSYYFQPMLFLKLGSREVPLDWPRTNVYFEKIDLDSETKWDHRGWGHVPLGELKRE